MKHALVWCLLAMGLIGFFCTDSTLPPWRDASAIEQQLQAQKELAGAHQAALFAVFRENLAPEERDALRWLYAYMPLSDLADYDGDFYLRQVRATLQARRDMPWAQQIPDDLFYHFVLPLRVNNENLDSARVVFYRLLKERVRGLSLREAALEINHWCHERVTYRGSDLRTSAPLATLRSAIGRCGEESVFAVAALRAVGIPARQVYVPRWAHSDDNHAWVEVWAGGRWYFLGACEPEPDLNRGWFKEAARRAMLVHTRVHGPYAGDEQILAGSARHREINVLSHYALGKPLWVKTVTADGRPLAGAQVSFRLYNYAEFYPLAQFHSDERGLCALETGLGDLLIQAHKEDLAGFSHVRVAAQDTLVVTLKPFDGAEHLLDLDFHPPLQKPALPDTVREEARQAHALRLRREDSLRAVYESTFADSNSAVQLARSLGLAADTLWNFLRQSRGNHREIKQYLMAAAPQKKEWLFPLLGALSQKDLRDAPSEILIRHLEEAAPQQVDKSLYVDFVLNPRIRNERLSACHKVLRDAFSDDFIAAARREPQQLLQWVERNIRLAEDANVYRVPLTPSGVMRTRSADALSRDILLVALCRSFGLAARLEPGLERPQVWDAQRAAWRTLQHHDEAAAAAPALLKLTHRDAIIAAPEYYLHYTLGRWEGGAYRTLELEGMPFAQARSGLELPAGFYCLITGTRQPAGAVLSRLHFIALAAGESRTVEATWRHSAKRYQTLGKLPQPAWVRVFGNENMLDLSREVAEKGMIVAWLDPGREPSQHVLREWGELKALYEQWGGALVALIEPQQQRRLTDYQLPSQLVTAEDVERQLLARLETILQSGRLDKHPILIGLDPQGAIVWLHQGYQVGLGDQMLQVMTGL